MIPVRFGAESREMLGLYHPPAQKSEQAPAVLICNAFGSEAVRSYRMLRLLADQLAARGCAVLRFDYFGTGDSPGEDEAASLVGWAGDIGSAHRELLARSGKRTLAWVGIRLGASLCALAAQTPRDRLQHVVMWDPVIEGEAFLESLAHAGDHHHVEPRAGVEALGFVLPDRFKNELRGLNLLALSPSQTRSTIVIGADTDTTRAWQASMAAAKAPVEWTVSAEAAEWNSDKAMNTATIPAALLREIAAKLLEARA